MTLRFALRFLVTCCALFLFSLPAVASTSAAISVTISHFASPPSGDATCATESSSHSVASSTAATLTLTNNTSLALSLFWLDFQGKRVKYFDLAPSTTQVQPTFTNYTWLVAFSNGTCIHLFTVTGPLQVTVGQAPSTPPPSLANARLQGQWRLQATVTSIAPVNGLPAGAMPPVGTSGVALVTFIPTCPSPDACSINANETTTGSASGTRAQGGLVAPGPTAMLVRSGSTYTYPTAAAGFTSCTGSFTHYFASAMTLNVTSASGTPLLATGVTGSERVLGASCVNGSIISFFYNLAINQGALATSANPGFSLPFSLPSFSFPASPALQPSISRALATPAQAFSSTAHTIVNIILTAAVVLFITFPAQLFNHTLEENWADMRRRLVHFFHLPKRLEAPSTPEPAPTHPRVDRFVFLFLFALGTLFGGLLYPHFGRNLPTMLALLGTAVTIWWTFWLSEHVAQAYRALRRLDHTPRLKALPAGLVVAGLCVLISRLTDFQPGYLYGLVFTIAFATHLAKSQEGFLTALTTLVSLCMALAAWFAWAAIHDRTETGLAGLAIALASTALAAVFVASLVNSVFSLAPVRFFPGHHLFSWRRSVWAITFGLAVFLLLQVLLLPAQGGHAGAVSLVTAVLLFVGFGAFSLAFWWYFAHRKSHTPASAPSA